MHQNENEYLKHVFNDVCRVVEQRIKNAPFCVIAIGGKMGVGKTVLSRYLSCRLEISLLETDLFLRPIETKIRYDYQYIQEILEAKKKTKRHIIVEGCSILQVLSKLEPSEIFLILIENKNPSGRLAVELIDFENTEICSIREMPNVDLNPDCSSALKAKANHTISW